MGAPADTIFPIGALTRALVGAVLIFVSRRAAGAVDDRDEFIRIVQVSMEPIDRDIELGEPVSRHHLRHAEEHPNPVFRLTPALLFG